MHKEDQSDWIFPIKEKFKLSENFLEKYKNLDPEMDVIGYVTFVRTYSRDIPEENRSEEWWETCKRVVEGMFTIQLNHTKNHKLFWDAWKAQRTAQLAYRLLFERKWSPAGRGLYSCGASVVYKRGSMPLINCSSITTEFIDKDFSAPFVYMMDVSMMGVGCGFNCRGAGKITFIEPKIDDIFVIDDSREGWCSAVKTILDSFVGKCKLPKEFDYSRIREKGQPLVTSGGIAPGPVPLKICIERLIKFLTNRIGKIISSTDIVHIMNQIGACVVAGGRRRTAQISFSTSDDEEFMTLKNPENMAGEAGQWLWASNNTIIIKDDETIDYSKFINNIIKNGEPGICFIDKLKKYGRLKDGIQNNDLEVDMTNPCLPKWAILLSKKGLTTLEEISIGDEIWSKEGWTKVLSIRSNGIKDVWKYSTTSDSGNYLRSDNDIYLTKEHKIFSNGKKIKIGLADNIDTVSTPEEICSCYKYSPYSENKKIISSSIYSTEEVYDITVNNSTHSFWCYGYDVANCGEIGLSGGNGLGGELCNLSTVYPSRQENFDEFKKSLEIALMYCKTVTLIPTHNEVTNAIILKNRRIGISLGGIVDSIQKLGVREFTKWCDDGYEFLKTEDIKYSNWLCIQKSIKLTTVAPNGSISLLASVSPGIHFPHSEFYIRRIRFSTNSPLIKPLKKAGYNWCLSDCGDNTIIFEFPCKTENFMKSKKDTNIFEQLQIGHLLQKVWSDNSVSQTITFKKEEINQLKFALELYSDSLKTVSFLPLILGEESGYKNLPYEEISKEEYDKRIKNISKIEFKNKTNTHDSEEKFCDGESCTLELTKEKETK